MRLSRRHCLAGPPALMLAGPPALMLAGLARPSLGRVSLESDAGAGPLARAARARGIRVGAARDHLTRAEDPALDALITRECDVLTPENGGKWLALQPEEGRFDWRRLDRALDEAKAIGADPNWHTVLWQHDALPDYMKLPAERRAEWDFDDEGAFSTHGTLEESNHWRRFATHAETVRAHAGDVFHRIDVANEVFFWETARTHPRGQDAYGFRKGPWWAVAGGASGPDWLDPFFHHLRRLFPQARLVINEFGIELAEGWQQRKRGYLLDWLKGARQRGCPIDGVGLQSHLIAGKPYDTEGMGAFLKAVDRLGLAIHVTELDVDETGLPGSWSREEKDKVIARTARRHIATILGHARLAELCWWNLRSDLDYLALEWPGRDLHPSPFDRDSRPLPLYWAAVRAITATTDAKGE